MSAKKFTRLRNSLGLEQGHLFVVLGETLDPRASEESRRNCKVMVPALLSEYEESTECYASRG
jgi:hypothetical protein